MLLSSIVYVASANADVSYRQFTVGKPHRASAAENDFVLLPLYRRHFVPINDTTAMRSTQPFDRRPDEVPRRAEAGADMTTHTEPYRSENFEEVKSLWEKVFPNDPPWNRTEVVIPAKMVSQLELSIVEVDAGSVVGTALAGYDGHLCWLYFVAVLETQRRFGVGSALVRTMEERLRGLGCIKINLQVMSLNLALVPIYHKLGYKT